MRDALRRLHPFDLAAAAVALTALAYLLVTVPGYVWSRGVSGGFLREVAVGVVLAVPDPIDAGLAAGLAPGAIEAETPRGPQSIRLESIEPAGEGRPLRLRLALVASVDGEGRAFWNEERLRAGEEFWFADRRTRIAGRLVEVTWRER